MPVAPRDRRPPMVVAMQLAHRVTAIAMELAIPAGLGYWLDLRFGTSPWLVVIGASLGFVVMMMSVLRLSSVLDGSKDSRAERPGAGSSRDSSR